jgi:quercetin dioxygenase-like cupin family protein
MRKTFVAAGLLLAALPLNALAMDEHAVVQPDKLKWGAPPPFLPPGAQIAVLTGHPGKTGPYVLRARMPKGYKIPAHTHPKNENVTVISGSMHIGMGPKLDTKKGEKIRAGGYVHVVTGMQHYIWVTEATVIQVHGIGPVEFSYVNPADDPRKQAKKTN